MIQAETKIETSSSARPTELLQSTVLPSSLVQQTTKLIPYGMLRTPTRHFFSDGIELEQWCLHLFTLALMVPFSSGDGLWGEHNPHFGKQKMGDSRW
jgi:hypothetical protein